MGRKSIGIDSGQNNANFGLSGMSGYIEKAEEASKIAFGCGHTLVRRYLR
jgi:hypothetical protein